MSIDQGTDTDVSSLLGETEEDETVLNALALDDSVLEKLESDVAAPTPETWCVARRRLGWSLDLAAREVGISPTHLDHIEVGVRSPDNELIARLAEVYGLDGERLEARARMERVPPRYDAETGKLWLGWLPIETVGFDNEQILTAIGSSLRTMRSLAEQHPVHIRDADLPVLAPLLDFEDRQLSRRLMTFLGLSPSEATVLVDKLKAAAN